MTGARPRSDIAPRATQPGDQTSQPSDLQDQCATAAALQPCPFVWEPPASWAQLTSRQRAESVAAFHQRFRPWRARWYAVMVREQRAVVDRLWQRAQDPAASPVARERAQAQLAQAQARLDELEGEQRQARRADSAHANLHDPWRKVAARQSRQAARNARAQR